MIRQLLVSLIIVVGAAAAYVVFVPGATEQLARFGINLPIAEPAAAATGPAGGQPGAQGRPSGGAGGPGGARGGGRPLVVVTSPVIEATINDKLSAIGEGAAARSVTVVSPASGTLAELLVAPGEMVAAGAVIGRLDADAERIGYERARLAQQDATAALDRARELANANNATTVQLNAAELAAKNADLQLQDADLALQRRTITTPIAGRVGLFQANPGNTVTAQTVVTTIEDTSHILVSFWVPERYASSIANGMPVDASAVALPGETIAGEVSAVDNRIDPASRTLKVEARIPNDDGRLRPGMSFSVALSFDGERFPSVDPLAIQWSSDGAYLWKYVDGKVERVAVEIIQRNSDGVLIQAELADGDQIVTQGIQQLSDGAAVRLLDEPAAPAADANGRQREGQTPA